VRWKIIKVFSGKKGKGKGSKIIERVMNMENR
jgi:hypothetical protein